MVPITPLRLVPIQRYRQYKNGVAEVEWQLNPDGMYYRDEDGFGMTDDEEIKLYGAIDRKGKVVKKFTLKRL